MALTATLVRRGRPGRGFYAEVSLVASGNYATGGDSVDFGIYHPTSRQPTVVNFQSKAGYVYKYDIANKKVLVFIPTTPSGNSPMAEHSAAAYNAAVIADTIVAQVWYMQGIPS